MPCLMRVRRASASSLVRPWVLQFSGCSWHANACAAAIQAGAGAGALSEATVSLVSQADPYVQVQCLAEVFAAAASDGISDPEWARLREVAGQTLGSGKVDDFIRLCQLRMESDKLFSAIVLGT